MVYKRQKEHISQWVAIVSIALKISCMPEALREWIEQHEIDIGRLESFSSTERERIKQIERPRSK